MTDLTAKAIEVFRDDIFASKLTGITIDHVDESSTRCSLEVNPQHRNAKGAVMGGVLFTFADFAFAIAANTPDLLMNIDNDNVPLSWVSSSANINFLSATKGDRLIATTQIIKRGVRQTVIQTTISDNLGNTVALVISTGINIHN